MIFKHHNDNCFDENAEKKYNSLFQRYMNFAEIRRMLFELEPLLEQASQYQGLLTELRIRRLKEKSNFQSQEIQEEYRKLKAIHD